MRKLVYRAGGIVFLAAGLAGAWGERPAQEGSTVPRQHSRSAGHAAAVLAPVEGQKSLSKPHTESHTGSVSEARVPAWDFRGSDLKEEELRPWLENGHPVQVHYQDGFKRHVFDQPDRGERRPGGHVLFLSTEEAARRLALQRDESAKRFDSPGELPAASQRRLSSQDYEVVSFTPGTRDDGVSRITQRNVIDDAVRGPDYSLVDVPRGDIMALEALLKRIVSFGHGGEMTFRVKNRGLILNEAGADFVIYENVFRFGPGLLYQEFARVGVSETDRPEDYRWFDCRPKEGVLIGCAGAVPTAEGGDQFDLASLGVSRARFIKIRDVGYNFSNRSANSEGFDLDALRLIHAYE